MAKRQVGRPTLDEHELRERKRRILDEALRIIGEDGVHNLRLRDVARASGVSVGTLQYYFDSRARLVQEAFAQHGYRTAEEVAASITPALHPWLALTTVFRHVVIAERLDYRSALWMEFASAARHDDELRELMSQVYEAWRVPVGRAVSRGVRMGLFAPVAPTESVVASILSLIDGYEIAFTIRVGMVTPEAIYRGFTTTSAALLGVSDIAAMEREMGQREDDTSPARTSDRSRSAAGG